MLLYIFYYIIYSVVLYIDILYSIILLYILLYNKYIYIYITYERMKIGSPGSEELAKVFFLHFSGTLLFGSGL